MQKEFVDAFINSTKVIIQQMTGIELENKSEPYDDSENMKTKGVVTIISFSGKKKGRLLIDIDQELMLTMAKNITGEKMETLRNRTVLAVATEISNIIAGDANTLLNNEYKLMLRLAPPVVFTAVNSRVSIPKIDSTSIDYETQYGYIKINVAFE